MSKWVKDAIALAIGLGIASVLFAFAFQFFSGSEGSVKITKTEFEAKVNPKLQMVSEHKLPNTTHVEKSNTTAQTLQSKKECRLPEHGVEFWGKTQAWNADSGWRKGGSSPDEFCAAQKLHRERQYPDRTVVLLNTSESHKSEYTPFKHDYYRYTCFLEDRWDPVYKLAENPKCP